jgi:DNA modification methylase
MLYACGLKKNEVTEMGTTPKGKLSEEFFMPPFSVLNARDGAWQKRKKEWLSLGIKSELGRGECITWTGDAVTEPGWAGRPMKGLAQSNGQDLMKGENKNFGKRLTWVSGNRPEDELDEVSRKILSAQPQSGTSIFDPVLCELVYRWFCPPGGNVLDPFAGGSVRGITAARLNLGYTGIDLSDQQIAANRNQAADILSDAQKRRCKWIVDDSRNVRSISKELYDLIFSCPPYADLEVYSDDPRDLSTLDYPDFISAYRDIIKASIEMLKPNRFACFVVGDIRDKKGFYRNFVSDTVAAFQDAGAVLYNEAILVTAVGSLPIRVRKQFSGYRKLGKTHQNVLVFYKGDTKAIKGEFGEVNLGSQFDQTGIDAWATIEAVK